MFRPICQPLILNCNVYCMYMFFVNTISRFSVFPSIVVYPTFSVFPLNFLDLKKINLQINKNKILIKLPLKQLSLPVINVSS